jgi:D-glucuronyl C5-epimerase C-terminus
VFVAFAGVPAAAGAAAKTSDVLVMDAGGDVSAHRATGSTPAERTLPRSAVRTAGATKAERTVVSELTRLRDSGAITPDDYSARRQTYHDAKYAARGLTGRRRLELNAVRGTLDAIADRGQLTPSRIPPLFLTLQRNTEWWTQGPLLSSGQRTGFSGSELVWQYYPGQGLQIQWLGTFGKLNALVKPKSTRTNAEASALTDEILSLASERAGGLAWEYEFTFGGGAPPWVSSLAQGTGLQALARAAVKLGRQADVLPIAQRGLAIFQAAPPAGVRVGPGPGWAGPHYLQYSFAPGLYILNGFTQSIVGLHDYAQLTGDPTAEGLYAEGERELEREVPAYDTGAWSLYERGTSSYESSLSYHDLLQNFLVSMCDRTHADVYCDTALRFAEYESQPPALAVASPKVRGGGLGTLRVRLSKISSVSVRIARGTTTVWSRALGTVGHGVHRLRWAAPKRRGSYAVQVGARDLNGHTATATSTVEVLKPVVKKRRKRG